MSVTLKVTLPRGAVEESTTMKLKADTRVGDVVQRIFEEAKLLGSPENFFLVMNPPKEAPRYLDSAKSLSESGATSKATFSLVPRYRLSSITSYDGQFHFCRLALPVDVPVGELYPFIVRKFKIDDSAASEFELYLEGSQTPIEKTKAIRDLRVMARDAFLFRTPHLPVDESSLRIFHDLRIGESSSSSSSSSMDATATSRDGSVNLNVGAKALLGQYPKLNGFVGKMSKKKKWERLFGIVHENYLFLYKTQNCLFHCLPRIKDPQPLCTLAMEQYDVVVMEDKKKKTFVKNGFELIPKATVDKKLKLEEHALKADNEVWVKQWCDALASAADAAPTSEPARATPERKSKRNTKKLKDVDSAPLVFGAPLANAVRVKDGSELPVIVTQTITWVEKHALKAEGIFRLSGSANEIGEYKRRYDLGETVSFEHEQDPHNVAGLLKLYFREMPEPIATWDMFFHFIIADFIENRHLRLRYIRFLLNRLPPLNRALLKYLVRFLIKVAEHADVNKMAVHNIATVFGPNLLRQKDASMIQMVEHTPQVNSIVDTLIKHYDYFFDNGPLEVEGDKFAGSAARALYDFEATTSEDLSFKKGDVIPIIYKGDDGWWHGEHEQKFASYVQPVEREVWVKADRKTSYHAEMAQLRQSLVEEDENIAKLKEKHARIEEQLAATRDEKEAMRQKALVTKEALTKALGDEEAAFRREVQDIAVKLDTLRSGRDGLSDATANVTEAGSEVNQQLQEQIAEAKRRKDKKAEKQIERVVALLGAVNKAFSAEQSAKRRTVRLEDEVRLDIECLEVATNLE